MVGKRVCVRYHQAISMGDKIAGAGSYPLDAFVPTTERRMIMDEVKYYPARMDYPNLCKPYSNADRIRSMSDAQLVQMLTIGRGGFSCSKCAESEDCSQNCEVQCLKWLQQPAEETDNG